MRIGLCTISNKDWPIEDVIDLAADLAFDGIEVWGQDHVGDGSPDHLESITDACEAGDLEIPVYGSYLRPGTDAYDEEWEHELDVTSGLGADLIRVWAGEQEFGNHGEDHWDRTVDHLEHLAEEASDRDVGVTVEKHSGTLTNRAAGARRLMEAVDAENCGINWQPAFDLTAEELPADLDVLLPWVNNVHVQALPRPMEWPRCPLSKAYFDLEALLETIDDSGFEGYYNVEFVPPERPYREAVAEDLSYLRGIAPSE